MEETFFVGNSCILYVREIGFKYILILRKIAPFFIFFDKPIICIIFIYNRFHIEYPKIEIDIIFYGYIFETESVFGDKKRETKLSCVIISCFS